MRRLLLLAPLALLPSCQAAPSKAGCTTVPIPYTKAQDKQAGTELAALPAGAELRSMMDDYGAERAALRAVCDK